MLDKAEADVFKHIVSSTMADFNREDEKIKTATEEKGILTDITNDDQKISSAVVDNVLLSSVPDGNSDDENYNMIVKKKRVVPTCIDSDDSDDEASHANVFRNADEIMPMSTVVSSSQREKGCTDKTINITHIVSDKNSETNVFKNTSEVKSTSGVLSTSQGDDSDDDNLNVITKKRIKPTRVDSDDENSDTNIFRNIDEIVSPNVRLSGNQGKDSHDDNNHDVLKKKRIRRTRIDSDESDDDVLHNSNDVTGLRKNELENNFKSKKSIVGKKRHVISALSDSDESIDDIRNDGLSGMSSENIKKSQSDIINEPLKKFGLDNTDLYSKDDSSDECESVDLSRTSKRNGEKSIDSSIEEINTNKSYEKHHFSNSNLYSRGDSDNDMNDNYSGNEAHKSRNKETQKKDKRKSLKSSKEDLKKIHSESQRMLRESRVSLPYHRPRQHSLAEFLQRRKSSVASIKDVNTLWSIVKEKEKEAEVFFKSDSEHSDADEPADCEVKESHVEEPASKESTESDAEHLVTELTTENKNSVCEHTVDNKDSVCEHTIENKDSVCDPDNAKLTSDNIISKSHIAEHFNSDDSLLLAMNEISPLSKNEIPPLLTESPRLKDDSPDLLKGNPEVCTISKQEAVSGFDTKHSNLTHSVIAPQELLLDYTETMDTDAFMNKVCNHSVDESTPVVTEKLCESGNMFINDQSCMSGELFRSHSKVVPVPAQAANIDFREIFKANETPDSQPVNVDVSICKELPETLVNESHEHMRNGHVLNDISKFLKNQIEPSESNTSVSSETLFSEVSNEKEAVSLDKVPGDRMALSLKSLIQKKENKNNVDRFLEKFKVGLHKNFEEEKDVSHSKDADCEKKCELEKPTKLYESSINFLFTSKIDSQDLDLHYSETEDASISKQAHKETNICETERNELNESSINFLFTSKIDSQDLELNYTNTEIAFHPEQLSKALENNMPEELDSEEICEKDKTSRKNLNTDETSSENAEQNTEIIEPDGMPNDGTKTEETVNTILKTDKKEFTFVPLSSDSETESPVIEPKKKFKLDERIRKLRPRLSGASEGFIDLDESPKKSQSGVQSLITRFLKHLPSKTKNSPRETEISVISAEKGADDIEIVKKDIVKITLGSDSTVPDNPDSCKPGAKHRRLREELRHQLALQRGREWSKKMQEVKLNEEDIDDGNLIEEEGEKIIEDNETESESEEEVEEDMEVKEKKRKKSAFVDDEAEEEDDGEVADVSDDDDDEAQDNEAEEEDDDDDNDNEGQEEELEEEMENDTTNKKSDKSDVILTGSKTPECTEDGKVKSRFQRVTTLDDSDSDADTTFTIPAYQPQGKVGTPVLLANASSTPRFDSPDITMTSSLCKWSSFKKTFRSPSTMSASSNDNSFHEKRQISPKQLFRDNSECLDNTNDFSLASRTLSDMDPDAELMGLCSGKFVSQQINLEELEKDDEKSGARAFEEGSQDIGSKLLLSDDSPSLGVGNMFPSLLSISAGSKTKTQTQQPSGLYVVDSDSYSDEDEEDLFKTKEKKKLNKKLYFSDDEEGDNSEGMEDGTENNLEFEDELDGKINKSVNYDSEENEVEELEEEEEGAATRPVDFFENEAELSESEWGSEDEDEKGLDDLESEDGDEEELDQKQLKEQLDKIHMRRMLDEDKREVRLLQEMLLEDGELHSEGQGRERKFRWKTIGEGGDDERAPLSGDENGGNEDDDDEAEEEWRRMKLEREKFLQEQQKKKSEDQSLCQDELLTENDTGKLLKLGMAAIRRSVSLKYPDVVTEKQTTTVLERTHSEPVASPKPKNMLNISVRRGSFLARGERALAKLAEISYSGPDGSVSGPKNSRNFVFATLSPEKDKKVEVVSPKKMVVKRKFPVVTPPAMKKLKMSDEKKLNQQRFFDSLLF